MIPNITMRRALSDRKLLGSVLDGPSWFAWRTMLIAMAGEKLTDEERAVFTKLTCREHEPLKWVEEFCAVVGRRGGKSRAMATLAVYLACLCKHALVRGEKGILLCVSPSQRQAKVVLDYARAAIEGSPMLRKLLINRTADSLELSNNISIEVRAASFRSLRGPTYIGCIADEAAFWFSDELSVNADVEILNSVRPGLGTTGGPLIIASSPYSKRGEVWETYRTNYGPDGDPLVLVCQGGTRDLNTTFSQRLIDRALAKDPELNKAEYLAQFRSDISSPFDDELVRGCVGDYLERAPVGNVRYAGFQDTAGGSNPGGDSWVSVVGHREGDMLIVDAIREARPKFSPQAVSAEHAAFFKDYGVLKISGDNYGGGVPQEMCRKNGVGYDIHKKVKSDLLRDLLPLMTSGRLTLPRGERMVNQFTQIERRTGRAGKDSYGHPEGHNHHDDIPNAIAGLADLLMGQKVPLHITRELLEAAARPGPYGRGRHSMGVRLTPSPYSPRKVRCYF